jgi:hypothetical protein
MATASHPTVYFIAEGHRHFAMRIVPVQRVERAMHRDGREALTSPSDITVEILFAIHSG